MIRKPSRTSTPPAITSPQAACPAGNQEHRDRTVGSRSPRCTETTSAPGGTRTPGWLLRGHSQPSAVLACEAHMSSERNRYRQPLPQRSPFARDGTPPRIDLHVPGPAPHAAPPDSRTGLRASGTARSRCPARTARRAAGAGRIRHPGPGRRALLPGYWKGPARWPPYPAAAVRPLPAGPPLLAGQRTERPAGPDTGPER
jgi:hypothetical protein